MDLLLETEVLGEFTFLDNLIDLLAVGGRSLKPLLPPLKVIVVLLVCLRGCFSSTTDDSSSGGREPAVNSFSSSVSEVVAVSCDVGPLDFFRDIFPLLWFILRFCFLSATFLFLASVFSE